MTRAVFVLPVRLRHLLDSYLEETFTPAEAAAQSGFHGQSHPTQRFREHPLLTCSDVLATHRVLRDEAVRLVMAPLAARFIVIKISPRYRQAGTALSPKQSVYNSFADSYMLHRRLIR